MKKLLRIAALALLLAAAGWWLATGRNPGWTKTSVPIHLIDEVTGIEYQEYENRFVPGVEVFGAIIVLSGLMLAGSLFVRSRPKPNP